MKKTQYCDVSITIHGKARDVDVHLFRGIAKDFTSNLSPTCCFPSGAGQTGRSANRLRRHSTKLWQPIHKTIIAKKCIASFYETMTNKPPILEFCLIGFKSREMSQLTYFYDQCDRENKLKNDIQKHRTVESRVEREIFLE